MSTNPTRLRNFEDRDAETRNVKKEVVNWARIDQRQQKLCLRSKFHASCALAAMTGSVLFGWNTAVLNTAGDHIASELLWCGPTEPQHVDCQAAQIRKTLLSTAVFVGAAISAGFGGLISSKYGLRRSTLFTLGAFWLGIISLCCANSFSSMFTARVIIGLAVGLISGLSPNYIAEMVPANHRGRYGVLHQIMICIAQLVCIVLGLHFQSIPKNDSSWTTPLGNKIWWRVMVGLSLIPVMIGFVYFGWVLSCETPKYYARRNNLEDAELLLKRVYDGRDVSAELENIFAESVSRDASAAGRSLWHAEYRRVLFVGLTVATFQQFTGINAFVVNSNGLFKDAGFSSEAAIYASICTVAAGVIFTLIPLFLLDKVGRKILLIIGAAGMSCSTLPATVFYWLHWTDPELDIENTLTKRISGMLALVGAVAFMIFYSISIGPITWIYIVEIFPIEIKDSASSICVCANWVSAMIMVLISGIIPIKLCYTIFTSASIIFLVFTLVVVRETKGLPLGDTPYVKNRLRHQNSSPIPPELIASSGSHF